MTLTSGPSGETERDVATTASRPAVVPSLADGVELIGEMEGSGYRSPPALVRRADGQVIQLTQLLYTVLAQIDGRRTLDEIAGRVGATIDRHVTADNVATLVEQRLVPLGLLRLADGSQPEVKRAEPLLGLRFRYMVTNRRITGAVTRPFAVLLNPVAVAVFVIAFLAVCWWVMFEKGLASATHEALYEPGLLLIVLAITVLSAGFHEFGHAAAARYGGATPGAMGMGLYLIWPAFYTDVTDSYRLGRAGRVRTDLGGLYFNAIVAVAMFGIWWASRWDALLLIIATQVLQMVRQLTPLVRFDGYHVLADLTGVPDLYHHIGPTLLGLLPQNWNKPRTKVLKPWARVVVSAWVLLAVPLLLLSLGLLAVTFPRLAATAWDSLGEQWATFETAFGNGDVREMVVRLLSMVAVALPLFGMVYVVTRLVRRVATSVWARTTAKPAQRTGAVVVALVIVAGLAWAWWPEDDKYRPIEAYERGTITDAASLLSAPVGLVEGRVARGTTLWPGNQPLPTADKPLLAVVLMPRQTDGGTTSPDSGTTTAGDATAGVGEGDVSPARTWVFPFNRPPLPSEGDNQALAVNTEDGSTVYDVAFALVWAEGDTTDNVNSAYALASCTGCQTVAVAFQVVLVLGQSDTIVPQNLAAAVNYSCIACVTYALATQLVVTLDGPLSGAAMTELRALWTQIAKYGENLEEVSFAEIRSQLTQFEAQILAIIEGDQGPVTGDRSDVSPSAGSSDEADPTDLASSNASTSTASSTPSSPTDTGPTPGSDVEPEVGGGNSAEPETTAGPTTGPTTEPTTEPTGGVDGGDSADVEGEATESSLDSPADSPTP